MTTAELRTDLLQQIEQADEKLLRVISSVMEAVKLEYADMLPAQLSDIGLADLRKPEMTPEEYEASLKPMTKEELIARAEAANEDIDAGRVYSLEQVEKMFGL